MITFKTWEGVSESAGWAADTLPFYEKVRDYLQQNPVIKCAALLFHENFLMVSFKRPLVFL